MQKKKHETSAARKARMQTRRTNRLFPFKKDTPLSEFIKPQYYCHLDSLISDLEAWLTSEVPERKVMVTSLRFDWSKPGCTPRAVCSRLARFFLESGGSVERTLGLRNHGSSWKVGELMRYLTHSDHSNIAMSEKSLNSLLNKEMRKIFNKS